MGHGMALLQDKLKRRNNALPRISAYCVCSKCGSEVPYISRRCIAVEDAKGTLKVFGKQVKLLEVCLKCLGELYGNPQLEPIVNEQEILQKPDLSIKTKSQLTPFPAQV
jgi:RAB protein geranylgeranyltransferase component A